MRHSALIFLILVLAGSGLSQRPSAVNRLYQYESALRDQIETLSRPLESTAEAPADTWIPLPKKRKAVGASRKVKLPAGIPLRLLSVERKGSRLYWSVADSLGQVFSLKNHSSFEDSFLQNWNQERRFHCADSLRQISSDHLRSLRRHMAEQELQNLNALAKRFRKERGRHRQMDPVALLRSQVLPDLNNLEEPLLLPWSDSLPLSSIPWGAPHDLACPPPEAEWPILIFLGEEEECWKFRFSENPETFYYIQPMWFQKPANNSVASDFGTLMADLAERRHAARRYDLLREWTPADVDRILNGLVWIGMSQDMLEEALGLPASRLDNGEGELWTFAEGNKVLLQRGHVTEINQTLQP